MRLLSRPEGSVRRTSLRIKIVVPFARRPGFPRSEDEDCHVSLRCCGASDSGKGPAPAASIVAAPCNMQPTDQPTQRLATSNVANKLLFRGASGLSTWGLRQGAAFALGRPRDSPPSPLFAMETRAKVGNRRSRRSTK